MHNIRIEYRRFWRRRVVETSFPESWSEMSARQFAALFSRPDDAELLSVMLGVGKRVVKRLGLMQIYELARLFDFVRRDAKISSFKLESFRCPGAGILYAPKPKLAEMTFEQFIYADSFYMQYAERGDADSLYRLTAYLYVRDSGFCKKDSERNIVWLKRADKSAMEAIALNYGLVRKWIAERYPLVFPSGGKRTEKQSGGSWPDVFDSIVGDDLKDRDKYASVPVNAVFKFISRKIQEARKHGSKV